MRGLRYVDPNMSIVSLNALNPIATPMTTAYNSESKSWGNKPLKNPKNMFKRMKIPK